MNFINTSECGMLDKISKFGHIKTNFTFLSPSNTHQPCPRVRNQQIANCVRSYQEKKKKKCIKGRTHMNLFDDKSVKLFRTIDEYTKSNKSLGTVQRGSTTCPKVIGGYKSTTRGS